MWIEPRPPGVGDASYLGSYGFSAVTGTITGTGTIFSAFWSHATRIAAITSLRWNLLMLNPANAGILTRGTSYQAFIARPFTTDFTNGTVLNLTGNSMKRRASMASSSFGSIRLWAAGNLTGGVGTFDPHPFINSLRKANRVNPATGTEAVVEPNPNEAEGIYSSDRGDHPIILAQNEGIVAQAAVSWPAGATAIMKIEMNWSEYETAADY
jgi:hypothetical protein